MQWTSAIQPGPHKLTEHQIDALDSLGRHHTYGRHLWQTWRALKHKGLVRNDTIHYSGVPHVALVLTDAGKIELARIQAEAEAGGY